LRRVRNLDWLPLLKFLKYCLNPRKGQLSKIRTWTFSTFLRTRIPILALTVWGTYSPITKLTLRWAYLWTNKVINLWLLAKPNSTKAMYYHPLLKAPLKTNRNWLWRTWVTNQNWRKSRWDKGWILYIVISKMVWLIKIRWIPGISIVGTILISINSRTVITENTVIMKKLINYISNKTQKWPN